MNFISKIKFYIKCLVLVYKHNTYKEWQEAIDKMEYEDKTNR